MFDLCRREENQEIKVGDTVLIVADGAYKGVVSTVRKVKNLGSSTYLYSLEKKKVKDQLEERREALRKALTQARLEEDLELMEMIIKDYDAIDEEIYKLKDKERVYVDKEFDDIIKYEG